MYLWKREFIRPTMSYEQARLQQLRLEALQCISTGVGIIFKRHECEWLLPASLAKHLKYNPRHLPVIQRAPDNEYYYLRMAIHRTIRGWVSNNWLLPNVWRT